MTKQELLNLTPYENEKKGENYNENLTIKDIAKLIRKYLKSTYNTYKFSVKVKDNDRLDIEMLESQLEIYKTFEELESWDLKTISIKKRNGSEFLKMTKQEQKNFLKNEDGKIVTHILNDVTKETLRNIDNYVRSYMCNNSNPYIDYYAKNFNYIGCKYKKTNVVTSK